MYPNRQSMLKPILVTKFYDPSPHKITCRSNSKYMHGRFIQQTIVCREPVQIRPDSCEFCPNQRRVRKKILADSRELRLVLAENPRSRNWRVRKKNVGLLYTT